MTRNINAINHATTYARDRGITITFEPGWETRSGTSSGRDSDPQAIYWHHTGGDYTSVAYLRDGDPARGLGCLANAAILRDGTVHVLSAKYANTEGMNDREAHEALIEGRAPLDRQVVPGADDAWSANSVAFGIEVIDRGDEWEPHVYRAATVFTAGLVEGYGFSRTNPPVGGHKEITTRKVDPWYDMAAARRDVRDVLAGGVPQMPAGVQPAPADPLVAKPRGNPYLPLKVDGDWGRGTTRALQFELGVTVDGLLGRKTYRALQLRVDAYADGLWGRSSKRALQRYLGVYEDGVIGPVTVRALQSRLNTNSF